MKINIINSVEDFNSVEKSFLKSKKICIDTEFVRENTYYPILSLVQLNINNEIFILDCYDKQSLLEKLKNILIDNDVLKIFHDCEQDIEIIQSNLNIHIKNIFDTQIANAFVSLEHHISYKNLVKKLLNKDVKKDQQHSNWIKRPLTKKQINYAGKDVIYLEELFGKLYKSLLNDNKLSWFKEEMENILHHINSKNNIENLLENPLGVAALTGTTFNIDRNYTTKKLKFSRPTNNSIDTVSDRDFVTDFLYAVSICSVHISRLSEEFIIWNSDAFGLIKLNDKVVTGSSIRPQKKNPDPLEFLRGKTGNALGNLVSMLTILKGLPLSYYKDLQDDKELVFKSFDQIKYSILILNEILKNFSVNKKRMLELANIGYTTATDLADYIASEFNVPFRKAYQITAKIVNYAEKKKKKLNELSIEEIKKIEPKLNKETLKVFDLKNSIKSKKSYGGTAFENIKKMINKYKKELK